MGNKVLLCSPSPNLSGGIAKWTKNVLGYYSQNGDSEIELLYLPIERKHFVEPSTSFILRFKYGISDYWSVIQNFKKVIKQKSPAVVHITTSASYGLLKDIFFQRIAKSRKVKNIIHFRFGRISELREKRNWEWYLLNYSVRKADVAIVIDSSSYATLIKAGHANVTFLPNPISLDLLNTIDKFGDIKRNNRTILFAGNLIQTKGVFELIRACIDIPNIKLKMMGHAQPGMKEQLLKLAMEKGGLEWIEITPNQCSSVVIKEMLSTAIFVLPSYTEGFPNVILESMACCCPIIATSVGAIPEMLNCDSKEQAGLCIAPQSVNVLQKAIERMLDDKVFAQQCAENARKRVIKKYTMPVVWNQLTSIWMNILTG